MTTTTVNPAINPRFPAKFILISGLLGLLLILSTMAIDTPISGNPLQRRIAVVDDSPYAAETTSELITIGLEIASDPYITCQQLLSVLNTGKRYTLYLVDYDPGETGGFNGFICTQNILAVHPTAIIIGFSADENNRQFFIEAGAKAFVSKRVAPKFLIQTLRAFIP